MDVSWLTTVTGRVGYAWDRWLAYAKGGWAGVAGIEIDMGIFDAERETVPKSVFRATVPS